MGPQGKPPSGYNVKSVLDLSVCLRITTYESELNIWVGFLYPPIQYVQVAFECLQVSTNKAYKDHEICLLSAAWQTTTSERLHISTALLCNCMNYVSHFAKLYCSFERTQSHPSIYSSSNVLVMFVKVHRALF